MKSPPPWPHTDLVTTQFYSSDSFNSNIPSDHDPLLLSLTTAAWFLQPNRFPSIWVFCFFPLLFYMSWNPCSLFILSSFLELLIFYIFIIPLICQAEFFNSSVSSPAQFSERNRRECHYHEDCSHYNFLVFSLKWNLYSSWQCVYLFIVKILKH